MTPAINSIFFSAKTKLALCVLAFITVAALAASTNAWLRPAAQLQAETNSPLQEAPATPGHAPRRGPVQTIRFALYELELLPREAVARRGFVTIGLEDFTGGGSQGLVVERRTGNAPERVGRIDRVEGHGRGKGELELTPGTYQIYDLSHPENRATLTVEP
jgi:hypothetical protein